jgi:isochorismate synthase
LNIFENITKSYKENLPFVSYRKPNSTMISGFFQNNSKLFYTDNFSEEGFVFAPFNAEEKTVLFPKDNAIFLSEKIDLKKDNCFETQITSSISSEENHLELVAKAIAQIDEGIFEKVVVSRKERVKLNSFELLKTFKKLLKNYTNAFVYVWFHPKVGLWLGATPETLLKVKENRFKTMSLAGTQLDKGQENVTWNLKEKVEQQLVTDFIKSQLASISNEVNIGEIETVKAGNLLHLKTVITGRFENQKLKNLIRALHPTPAVCGFPREETKRFIHHNENYKRSFYTGFLGELNFGNSSELFVNLRCMEIENNTANIYIGGGITKDSNPKKEWEETVAKSKVMSRVL